MPSARHNPQQLFWAYVTLTVNELSQYVNRHCWLWVPYRRIPPTDRISFTAGTPTSIRFCLLQDVRDGWLMRQSVISMLRSKAPGRTKIYWWGPGRMINRLQACKLPASDRTQVLGEFQVDTGRMLGPGFFKHMDRLERFEIDLSAKVYDQIGSIMPELANPWYALLSGAVVE